MALARLDPSIASLTGKLGPLQVQGLGGTTSIRPRRSVSNPQTPLQVAHRSRVATAHAMWGMLNDDLWDQWDAYARVHGRTADRPQVGRLTGHAAWMQYIIYALVAQQYPSPVPPALDSPPLHVRLVGGYAMSATNDLRLLLDDPLTVLATSGLVLLARIYTQQSPTQPARRGSPRLVYAATCGTDPLPVYPIRVPYPSGSLTPGHHVWVGLAILRDDGALAWSPAVSLTVT